MQNAPTPVECFRRAIIKWEGGWQANPNDRGNYTPAGRLVGTMHGVTVGTYAAWKRVDPETLTPAVMRAEITVDVAEAIYERKFFVEPGIAKLPWSPLAEVVADIGWGSGPAHAIEMLQLLVGAKADGVIGPKTNAATSGYLARRGAAVAVDALASARRTYYLSISEPGSRNAAFRAGWLRRADWYTTDNPEWWSQWSEWAAQARVQAPPQTPSPPAAPAGDDAARERILAQFYDKAKELMAALDDLKTRVDGAVERLKRSEGVAQERDALKAQVADLQSQLAAAQAEATDGPALAEMEKTLGDAEAAFDAAVPQS